MSVTSTNLGDSFDVTLTNGRGAVFDWLALAVVGDPDSVYSQWTYIGEGNTSFTWTVGSPAAAGQYEVRVAYTTGSNRATNAPFTVRHADGEKTLAVDQKRKPPVAGTFLSLGRFQFEEGKRGSVIVSNKGTTGHVIARGRADIER